MNTSFKVLKFVLKMLLNYTLFEKMIL